MTDTTTTTQARAGREALRRTDAAIKVAQLNLEAAGASRHHADLEAHYYRGAADSLREAAAELGQLAAEPGQLAAPTEPPAKVPMIGPYTADAATRKETP